MNTTSKILNSNTARLNDGPPELKSLRGPSELLSLDLTHANLNISLERGEGGAGQDVAGGEIELELDPMFSLLHAIKILNLTRSLIQVLHNGLILILVFT